MIPVDQIELSEEFAFREKIDEETVERYAELWAEYKKEYDQFYKKKTGDEPQCPFPNIFVLKTGEEKYAVISGVHRLKSAQKVGLTEIFCVILTDRAEAVIQGLQDNREHGLQLTKDDCRKCILIARQEFGGQKSNREIARLIGCSHTYVNRVCQDSEVETSFHSKPKKGKKQEVTGDCEDIASAKEYPITESDRGVDELEEESVAESVPTGQEVQSLAPPPAEKPNDLLPQFKAWIASLPAADTQRVRLFQPLITALLSDAGFSDNNCRRDFAKWLAKEAQRYL